MWKKGTNKIWDKNWSPICARRLKVLIIWVNKITKDVPEI